MAGDFDLSARITADASGLVQAGAQGEAAYEGLERAQRDAAAGARELEVASESATKAQDGLVAGSRSLTAAQTEAMRTTRASTTETLGQAVARERAAQAAINTAAAEARLANAQSAAERSAASAALAALRLEQAQTRHSASTTQLDRDLAQLRAELDPVGEAQRRLAQATDLANTALQRGIITQEQYETHLRRLNTVGAASAADMNRQAFAVRNLGQQFGDLGTQVALGGGFARAFASQAGQMGYALSEFSGKLGAVGRFLTGPWGIALTTGAVLAAPFIGKLFEGSNAAQEQADSLDKAAQAADSYGAAQSLLGKIVDLTTGKFKTQNVVLIESIKLLAQANLLKAQQDLNDADPAKRKGLGDRIRGLFSEGEEIDAFRRAGGNDASGIYRAQIRQAEAQERGLAAIRKRLLTVAGNTALAESNPDAYQKQVGAVFKDALAGVDRLAVGGKVAGKNLLDVKKSIVEIGTAANNQAAAFATIAGASGGPLADFLKPYERPKKGRTKKPASTAARDEFGRDAADKIANIVGQFDETPAVIDKTNAKIRELDDLIEDLGRRRPVGFEDLIEKAEAAKIVVREGLIREVGKAFEAPKTLGEKAAAALAQLDAVIADLNKSKPAGFEKLVGDAERVKQVVRDGLQKPYADFVKDQRQSLEVGELVLQGRVDEANALKTIQQLQATGLVLTDAQKAAVLATTQAMRAQARAIDDLRQRNAKYIEAIGSIRGIVDDATQAFVRGDLGQLLKSPGKLLDAFQTFQGRALFDRVFGGLFQELEDQVNGTSVVKDASDRMATAVDKASASIVRLGNAADQAAGGIAGGGVAGTAGGATTDANGDIIVNGRRDPVSTAIGKIATRIGEKVGIKDPAAFGKEVGKNAGKALEGAATGSIVAGVGKALGVKLNSTGAQLGGAIGNFLPIPGGSIIGSLAGGLLGNLFQGRAKPGGATVSNVNGEAAFAGGVGSDKAGLQIGKDLAGSVANGINAIAAQLGGSLGNFNVSIGKYKDDLRVNVNGRPLGGVKGSGAVGFGEDQAAAVSYAISQAIAQGAVTGLSAAVQEALASSTDVDRALAEALKVREVETLIGGLGSALKLQFDTFDKSAAERVRVARQYGLDLVAVEKINGEQRAKLVDDTLKSRIGSLSDFLDQLKFGDLAEGTAADKRTALLERIKAAQADAEAGKDGAADLLAQLYGQLVQNSRDAFGTAGPELASDRASAQSGVERVIRMETERVNQAAGITAAAQATADAVRAGNTLTGETNDLLAQVVAESRNLSSLLASKLGNGGSALDVDYSATARTVLGPEFVQ